LIAPRTKSRSVPAPIFSNSPNVISVLYITYGFLSDTIEAQTAYCWIVQRLDNKDLDMIWREVVVAQSELLLWHSPRRTEEDHKEFTKIWNGHLSSTT
jgi:hypothetical protein